MDIIRKKIEKIHYKDYPPTYDKYGKQKIEYNIEAAINIILNILYTRDNILPSLPDVFIDIEQYKHEIANNVTANRLRAKISESIKGALPKLKPDVFVELDKATDSINIEVVLYDDVKIYKLAFGNAQDKNKLNIKLNKKPFYS